MANLQTLPTEIKMAKHTAGKKGVIAVNIMSVTQLYGEYVRIAVEAGNPQTAKYCISQALIHAVKGDLDNGRIFCSAKVDKIRRIQTVREVMEELLP